MCFGQTQGRKTVQFFRPPRILTRRTKTASEVTVRFTWSWRFLESRELVRTVPLTSPVQQSPSVLQAELWGLCSLDLACSAAPSRRVNDGRPDSFYDFFFFLMIFRRAYNSWWTEIRFVHMFATRCYRHLTLQRDTYIWQYRPWHKGLCQWHTLEKRYILSYAWLP